MDKVNVQNTILESISNYCKVDSKNITLDTELKDCIKNSIEFIKIIVDIEDAYDIVFSNEDLTVGNYTTLRDLSNFVHQKIM